MRNLACAARPSLGSASVQKLCFLRSPPPRHHHCCHSPKEPVRDTVLIKNLNFQKLAKREVLPKASLTPYFFLALYIVECRLRKSGVMGGP